MVHFPLVAKSFISGRIGADGSKAAGQTEQLAMYAEEASMGAPPDMTVGASGLALRNDALLFTLWCCASARPRPSDHGKAERGAG